MKSVKIPCYIYKIHQSKTKNFRLSNLKELLKCCPTYYVTCSIIIVAANVITNLSVALSKFLFYCGLSSVLFLTTTLRLGNYSINLIVVVVVLLSMFATKQ